MAVDWLKRLAAGADVPIYPCIGPGMLAPVEQLFLSPGMRRASTPREAAVLLVAGAIPDAAQAALDRLHDQLPHPRASFRWDGQANPSAELTALWRDVLDGRPSEDDRLADESPNEWRGKGDHGQGGEGMMGGVPYGRPMAMTADDIRDGLALDAYTARIGPFAPMLLPGLVLEVTLQGNVIVSAKVCAPPFEQTAEAVRPAFCAARLLMLLGLPLDAHRLWRRKSARGLASLRAVPKGLGEIAPDDDVRARLTGWLQARPSASQAPALPDLLPGLEWHEATLVLNSFTPDALRRACLAETGAA